MEFKTVKTIDLKPGELVFCSGKGLCQIDKVSEKGIKIITATILGTTNYFFVPADEVADKITK